RRWSILLTLKRNAPNMGSLRPSSDGSRQPCHQLRSFCLLYAAFKRNALLWNGGQHECRILVPNPDRYHCLWHLDCRWHDRRWLAFGLGAHGNSCRHCGFDQPLSSNSRSQNRVAEHIYSAPTPLTRNSSCQTQWEALGGVLPTAAWQRPIARSKKIATATWWLQPQSEQQPR